MNAGGSPNPLTYAFAPFYIGTFPLFARHSSPSTARYRLTGHGQTPFFKRTIQSALPNAFRAFSWGSFFEYTHFWVENICAYEN